MTSPNPKHMRHAAIAQALVGVLLCGPAACSRDDTSGPPEIRLASDQCAECGMLISEPRSAAALLVDDRGRRDYLLFDDPGCLLDYEAGRTTGPTVIDRFMMDRPTSAWARASDAVYVMADPDRLPTPMGSGIAAFAAAEEARAALDQHGGRLLSFDELAAARRDWMAERYGTPAEGR